MKTHQLMMIVLSICSSLFFSTGFAGQETFEKLEVIMGFNWNTVKVCKESLTNKDQERIATCSDLQEYLLAAQAHYTHRRSIEEIQLEINEAHSCEGEETLKERLQTEIKKCPAYEKPYKESLSSEEQGRLKQTCKRILSWLPTQSINPNANALDKLFAGHKP